jgi:hypothetical protein
MNFMIPIQAKNLTDLIIWADNRWPSFYAWAAKDPEITPDETESVLKHIKEDDEGVDAFVAKLLDIASTVVLTEEERRIMKNLSQVSIYDNN